MVRETHTMRIALLTCIHGRHAVSEMMLRHHAEAAGRLRESTGCEFQIAAVLSPEDQSVMGPICDALGVRWKTYRNKPVSAKWQVGVGFVREVYADVSAVMIAGSDDFLSGAYMAFTAGLVRDGWSLGFGPDRCWMLDSATGRLGLWRRPYDPGIPGITAGAGRVFTRELLDRVGWRLWTRDQNRALDTLCSKRLRALGYRLDAVGMTDRGDRAVIDVKTAENIHRWDAIPYVEVLGPEAAACHIGNLGLNRALEICK